MAATATAARGVRQLVRSPYLIAGAVAIAVFLIFRGRGGGGPGYTGLIGDPLIPGAAGAGGLVPAPFDGSLNGAPVRDPSEAPPLVPDPAGDNRAPGDDGYGDWLERERRLNDPLRRRRVGDQDGRIPRFPGDRLAPPGDNGYGDWLERERRLNDPPVPEATRLDATFAQEVAAAEVLTLRPSGRVGAVTAGISGQAPAPAAGQPIGVTPLRAPGVPRDFRRPALVPDLVRPPLEVDQLPVRRRRLVPSAAAPGQPLYRTSALAAGLERDPEAAARLAALKR